jgi:uncharacterized short protein YbdD (DUF466 family)
MRRRLRRQLGRAWAFLRALSGDSDYERFAARARLRGQPVPTPREFYLDGLRRRYSGPSRCC